MDDRVGTAAQGWKAPRRVLLVVGLGLAVALVGCGSGAESNRRVAASEGVRANDVARAAFVTEADATCDRFREASRSLAGSSVATGPFGGFTAPEAVSFYRGLLPIAETYLDEVGALDAPVGSRGAASSLVTDAYETWLGLVQVDVAAAGNDATALGWATTQFREHLLSGSEMANELAEQGFAVCGQRDWLLLFQIDGAAGIDADLARRGH